MNEDQTNQISLIELANSSLGARLEDAGSVRELCDRILQALDLPREYAVWQKNRTAWVLKLGSQAVLSISETRGGCRIQARAGCLAAEQAGLPLKPDDDTVLLDQLEPGQQAEALRQYIEQVADQGSGDRFACCSRYRSCSAEAACVQPDRLLALDCAYRLNLKKGRLFYG